MPGREDKYQWLWKIPAGALSGIYACAKRRNDKDTITVPQRETMFLTLFT
ncbi:hypothetical protein PMX15_003993 [Escherichia coli]|nr:hypothetical protein [Escherichia coli]